MSIPFANVKGAIPTFPEEDKVTTLNGAPLSEKDSVFLNESTLKPLAEYATNPTKETLSRSAQMVCAKALRNPRILSDYYNDWEGAIPSDQDTKDPRNRTYAHGLIVDMEKAVIGKLRGAAKNSGLQPDKPEDVYAIMDVIYYISTESAGVEMLKGLLDRELTVKQLVDLRYFATEWALSNFDVSRWDVALGILAFSPGILSKEHIEKMGKAAAVGMYDLDLETFRKAVEVDGAMATLAPMLNPDLHITYGLCMSNYGDPFNPAMRKHSEKAHSTNHKLASDIEEYHKQRVVFALQNGAFPQNPTDSYPSRYLSEHQGKVNKHVLNIYYDVRGREEGYLIYNAPNQPTSLIRKDNSETMLSIQKTLREAYSGSLEANGPTLYRTAKDLTDEEALTAISYLHPNISYDDIKIQMQGLIATRNDLYGEIERTVSPRGDFRLITDPKLRELGYRGIFFKAKGDGSYEADVYLGSYKMSLGINRSFQLVSPVTGKELHEPPYYADRDGCRFLSLMVLSELGSIVFGKEDPEPDPDAQPEDSSREETKETARRAHPRILPPGEKPSKPQITLAMKYSVDLERINEERAGQGLTPKTFVREVLGDISTPFFSKAATNMDMLVGKVSTTETSS